MSTLLKAFLVFFAIILGIVGSVACFIGALCTAVEGAFIWCAVFVIGLSILLSIATFGIYFYTHYEL